MRDNLTATARLVLAKDGPRLFDALPPTGPNIEAVEHLHIRIRKWCLDNDVCDRCWRHDPNRRYGTIVLECHCENEE